MTKHILYINTLFYKYYKWANFNRWILKTSQNISLLIAPKQIIPQPEMTILKVSLKNLYLDTC